MSPEKLAKALARGLIKAGDDERGKCTRIQFHVRNKRGEDIGSGGYCEIALSGHFSREIARLGLDPCAAVKAETASLTQAFRVAQKHLTNANRECAKQMSRAKLLKQLLDLEREKVEDLKRELSAARSQRADGGSD